MRPPTRSTRSVRQPQRPSKKVSPSARGSLHTPSFPAPFLLEANPQSMKSIADANIEVGSSVSTVVGGCLPSESWPPTTFVYENQRLVTANYHAPIATVTPAGKLPRSRHRMTSDKLETLEGFFRRNTHPSRKEKEAICKDLDMDLKTVTIWFQNKRQTVARSRKQSESLSSEGLAQTSTAAMDMLASASATMIPLASAPSPFTVATAPRLGFGFGGSCASCSSLDNLDPPASRLLHDTSSCTAHLSTPKSSRSPFDSQPRIPLSSAAAAQGPNVSEPALPLREMRTSSTRVSSSTSSSPELRKPRNNHPWPIDPENLWKYIPSSPVQRQPIQSSSPDVSPDVGVGGGGDGGSANHSLRRRPRTLEWACARSSKRRRANPDSVHSEDGETDTGCKAEDRTAICHLPCCVSDARVPPEYYGKYPLDVVRGAVLLLGLRDAAHGLGV